MKRLGIQWDGAYGNLRILCNLQSGATNPHELRRLSKVKNVFVRTHPRLHSKLYLSDTTAIVGSADVSANGLSYEGAEMHDWLETALITHDAGVINDAHQWFDHLWESAQVVDDDLIRQARVLWNQRRVARPFLVKQRRSELSFLEFIASYGFALPELRDRVIVTTYADKRTDGVAKRMFNDFLEDAWFDPEPDAYDFYSDWHDPRVVPGKYVLDFPFSSKGTMPIKPKCGGLFRIERIIQEENATITVVKKVDAMEQIILSEDDQTIFRSMAQTWLEDLIRYKPLEEIHGTIDFTEFYKRFKLDSRNSE